jgi:hypothetical protein
MAQPLAEFECGGETLAGEFAFAEPQVGEPTEVETVGPSPSVLAVGVFRAVERVASVLEGFARVSSREERFGERKAELDRVFSETASIGQKDAGFGFGNRLRVISQMPVKFAGRVEAAELEIDYAGVAGECTGFLKVLGSLGWIVR